MVSCPRKDRYDLKRNSEEFRGQLKIVVSLSHILSFLICCLVGPIILLVAIMDGSCHGTMFINHICNLRKNWKGLIESDSHRLIYLLF